MKMIKIIILLLALGLLFFLYYFFILKTPKQQTMVWGVNCAQTRAESLKLDWRETYNAILGDLGAKNIKLHTQWDWVEGEKNDYFFQDIDWQLQKAKEHGAGIVYVVGMKSGRWPECHLPDWAEQISKDDQQKEILEYIQQVVLRYKDNPAIIAWQAENEPLFKFGECPWYDKDFLKKEVSLIKSLDPSRPVIVSDSGEQSLWLEAASIGDIVGTTLYRKVWVHVTDTVGFYIDLPFSPKSYWIKAEIIKRLFGKKVINIELQAEPWFPNVFKGLPLEEQEKTMNLNQFRKNIEYAEKTGLDEFYFWGTEWWYWMKETQDRPEIWDEAKKLFKS